MVANTSAVASPGAVREPAPAAAPQPAEVNEAEPAQRPSSDETSDDAAVGSWPDDAAESAFRAEARERGETVAAPKPREEADEEPASKALPALNELVERIPAEVRETLEELFRARFVTVKRLPKKALKS